MNKQETGKRSGGKCVWISITVTDTEVHTQVTKEKILCYIYGLNKLYFFKALLRADPVYKASCLSNSSHLSSSHTHTHKKRFGATLSGKSLIMVSITNSQ